MNTNPVDGRMHVQKGGLTGDFSEDMKREVRKNSSFMRKERLQT